MSQHYKYGRRLRNPFASRDGDGLAGKELAHNGKLNDEAWERRLAGLPPVAEKVCCKCGMMTDFGGVARSLTPKDWCEPCYRSELNSWKVANKMRQPDLHEFGHYLAQCRQRNEQAAAKKKQQAENPHGRQRGESGWQP